MMNIADAYKEGKIGRFEIMHFAEVLSDLNKQNRYSSLKEVEFRDGHFLFPQTDFIKKKEVLLYFSLFMSAILTITDKRIGSIFFNHYLACQNNTDFFKFLPKARKKPFLVCCGGLSGSGKSRVAREIAWQFPCPFGAVIIRDDIVRKQLAGVRFDVELTDQYYTSQMENRVYKEMRRQAKQALKAGYSVIMDALFYSPRERSLAENLAKRMNLRSVGFWMEAPLRIRAKRVQERLNNPSDVKTKEALKKQEEQELGEISWHYIRTDGEKDETIRKVMKIVKRYF